MATPKKIVYVDTNAIIEATRTGCLKAILNHYARDVPVVVRLRGNLVGESASTAMPRAVPGHQRVRVASLKENAASKSIRTYAH